MSRDNNKGALYCLYKVLSRSQNLVMKLGFHEMFVHIVPWYSLRRKYDYA
ncbi:hypothetical protein ViNHUV68_15090 [Vibrio sp. NH-UV-68]